MLQLFFLIPLLAFFIGLFPASHQEKTIARIARWASIVQTLLTFVFAIYWFLQGAVPFKQHGITLYRSAEFNFGIDFYYDAITSVELVVSALLSLIVVVYSKTYMHRERGYKRLYNHYMLFYGGLNLLLLSGNFETFFLGWEIVGISSFLLIAFYRERYLPVRNAMKVLSFYRLGDVALMGGIWFSHHLFEENIRFDVLEDAHRLMHVFHQHPTQLMLVGALFIMAAAVKSAQFPFFSWLPRAMEGPTVSSAIFYGALSIHLGIFLLLRTYPMWSLIPALPVLLVIIGLLTVLLAYPVMTVQTAAKPQLAYAIILQLGLMFIEIGLGFPHVALWHMVGHAMVRSYQLLASPSAMTYRLRDVFYGFKQKQTKPFRYLPNSWQSTLYVASVNEWYLDGFWLNYLWQPAKRIGKSFHFIRTRSIETITLILLFSAVIVFIVKPIPALRHFEFISILYGFVALILSLVAWTERRSATRSWVYITLCQLFFMLAVIEQHRFNMTQLALFLSGTLLAFLVGYWSLHKVSSVENNINLNEFHGHVYEHPRFALTFLIAALMMSGFPISPAFIGYDILFSEIDLHHPILLMTSFLIFILLELTVLRIYARVFLGQHVKTYHEVAFRSA
ncbi:MAG: proton-conducting transporter membrane subunit [Chitinophagaceae bacterium]